MNDDGDDVNIIKAKNVLVIEVNNFEKIKIIY